MRRVSVLAGLLLLFGCDDSGRPVHFVVPKGFVGPIAIVADPSASEVPLVGERYEVSVPAGGVLRVRSFEPFERWHETTAAYDDGSPLRYAREIDPHSGEFAVDRGTVAIRGGETVSAHFRSGPCNYLSFHVGTKTQLPDARPRVDGRSPCDQPTEAEVTEPPPG